MRNRWFSLLLLVAVVASSLGWGGAARAQDATPSPLPEIVTEFDLANASPDQVSIYNQYRAAASIAATSLLQLAADGDYNTMVDLLHEDAKTVWPRGAALGALNAIYTSSFDASAAQIVSVDLYAEWTWNVNGTVYPVVAKVAYVIPHEKGDTGGSWVEDTLWIQIASTGDYAWFLGTDPATVAAVREMYIDGIPTDAVPVTGGKLVDGDYIENVVNDLDAFYADVVSYTPYNYVSPAVVIVPKGKSVRTACGPAKTGFWGFYCPLDATMYLDEPLLDELAASGDDFAAAFVIAHEWAHHIQTGVGFDRTTYPKGWNEVYSIELELMADCMSGAWARDADDRGILEPGDIDEAVNFAVTKLGDPKYVDEYSQQAHGSGKQRQDAFLGGYYNGFSACNLKI